MLGSGKVKFTWVFIHVGLRESQVHIGVCPGGPTLFQGVRGKQK